MRRFEVIMKVTVIGGGSTYTPELTDGFIKRAGELAVDTIVLMDIDEKRLEIVGGLAKRMMRKAGLPTKIVLTTDRREAMEGADFVISSIRVGLMEGRILDERIPLKYGVVGQETTGPGGFAMALRTIPVMLDYAKDIVKWSPNAWLINFTNPSGIITEAVSKYSEAKVIGLCNVPINMLGGIAKALNVEEKKILLDYVGLNHLSWIKGVYLEGKDVLPEMIEKMKELAEGFDLELIKTLHMIPNWYLHYYYDTDKVVEEMKKAKKTRGEETLEIENKCLEIYKDQNLEEKPKLLEKRGGARYSDAALSLVSAIVNNKNEIHIVNIPNKGAIKDFSNNAVVEIPAIVNSTGPHPITIGEVPPEIEGLMHAVKAYEELTIEAAIRGSREMALKALLIHPLVPSFDVAKKILNDLLEAHKKYLPKFF